MLGRKMRMLKHEDMEAVDWQVSVWLEKRGIPHQSYRNLPTSDKVVLRNLVCMPSQPTTYNQRRDLYRRLCLPGGVAGRESSDSVEPMPDEERRRFFSPLTPGERLPNLYKY